MIPAACSTMARSSAAKTATASNSPIRTPHRATRKSMAPPSGNLGEDLGHLHGPRGPRRGDAAGQGGQAAEHRTPPQGGGRYAEGREKGDLEREAPHGVDGEISGGGAHEAAAGADQQRLAE